MSMFRSIFSYLNWERRGMVSLYVTNAVNFYFSQVWASSVNFLPSPAPQLGFSCEDRPKERTSEFWFVLLYQNLNIQTVVSDILK